MIRINFFIAEKLLVRLKQKARELGISVAEVIRRILDEHFNRK